MNRLALLLAATAIAAFAAPQELGDPEKRADEVAIVSLNGDTLRALANLCGDEKDNDAEFARALSHISAINVRALEFHDHRMPSDADISAVRTAAVPSGWPKFLSSRSKDPDEIVEGYLAPDGLALLSWEPGEIAVVRITGSVSPAALPSLGRHFGVPTIPHGIVYQTPEPGPSVAPRNSSALRPDKLNFGQMVRNVEARESIRHLRIPFLGLVKPVAFVASAGSVRALDMAIFEDAPPTFLDGVTQAVPRGWSPFVQVRERSETTNIWLGEVNSSMQLLIATQEPSEGVLLTTKVRIADLDKDPFRWGHRHGN